MRRMSWFCVVACLVSLTSLPARAQTPPVPLAHLSGYLRAMARQAPGQVALDVIDLASGYSTGYDASASMPAASTIKIPVMVEVFRQLQAGRFDLGRRVTLRNSDKDWGSGELCDAPAGRSYPVSDLLAKMIDISDNTATNMLIRLVGRHNINASMYALGLRHTVLANDIRSDGYGIRYDLRSSPHDLAQLLSGMAHQRLVDEWSSAQMIAILSGQEHNTLIPEPLPPDLAIAHKTGTLHDTLNDVGIVYADNAPYVIAVMTTDLPTLSAGRRFIRGVSRLAYREMAALADWRTAAGVDVDTDVKSAVGPLSPDVAVWVNGTN
ncbi:MAG TPA: serine hydrolase [Candidatus Baltobacteraceae bacterium]|jgi:beta-lactamase class A